MLLHKNLFSPSEKKEITDAIAAAEMLTSGEIRVHIEPKCKVQVLARAVDVFNKLDMHKTEKRNGILIYLAYEDQRFAIIGDKGINDVVPADFWDSTKEVMSSYFKKGQFLDGVIYGINESASHLAKYFPHRTGDKNELSNEISEG